MMSHSELNGCPVRRRRLTDLNFVGSDVEDADHAGDEGADGFEIDAPDAPGSVHQQHDVGLGRGLTLRV